VLAEPQTVVTAIADPPLVALHATDDREHALELFEKYDRVALPVTDALGNMLGIVTADDMLDIAESEATEDIQKLGGSEALDAPYIQVGLWSMIRKRGGWLSFHQRSSFKRATFPPQLLVTRLSDCMLTWPLHLRG
jgi:magnesium transporter